MPCWRVGSAVSLKSQTTCNTLAFSFKIPAHACAYCHHRRRHLACCKGWSQHTETGGHNDVSAEQAIVPRRIRSIVSPVIRGANAGFASGVGAGLRAELVRVSRR